MDPVASSKELDADLLEAVAVEPMHPILAPLPEPRPLPLPRPLTQPKTGATWEGSAASSLVETEVIAQDRHIVTTNAVAYIVLPETTLPEEADIKAVAQWQTVGLTMAKLRPPRGLHPKDQDIAPWAITTAAQVQAQKGLGITKPLLGTSYETFAGREAPLWSYVDAFWDDSPAGSVDERYCRAALQEAVILGVHGYFVYGRPKWLTDLFSAETPSEVCNAFASAARLTSNYRRWHGHVNNTPRWRETMQFARDLEQIVTTLYENKQARLAGTLIHNAPTGSPWGKLFESWPRLDARRTIRSRKLAYPEGDIPSRMHRLPTDGQVFSRKRKFASGTVLLDVSGSMDLEYKDIQALVDLMPMGIVAVYSGLPKNTSIRNNHTLEGIPWKAGTGWVTVIANKGRILSPSLFADFVEEMPGYNIIDVPVMNWLVQQPGPRFLVSDGLFTDLNEDRRYTEGQQYLATLPIHWVDTLPIRKCDNAVELMQELVRNTMRTTTKAPHGQRQRA